MFAVRSGSNNCIPSGLAASVAAGSSLSDISEYLKDIPLDWLSDAANLLNHTLQFNCLTPNLSSSNGSSAGVDDGEVSAIVRGAKQVRVPPGEGCSHLKIVRAMHLVSVTLLPLCDVICSFFKILYLFMYPVTAK